MFIEIENTEYNDREITARKGTNAGTVYFARTQQALMFKEGSKYPDKFPIDVHFSDSKKDRDESLPFPVGKYVLADDAYYINRDGRPVCNFNRLKQLKSSQ